MIKAAMCHTIVCDGCGQTLNPADEGEIHFSDAHEARAELHFYEWTSDGERDLCPSCTADAQCAEHGHVPALDVRGEYCDRCEEKL
jgi:hypothetical protein